MHLCKLPILYYNTHVCTHTQLLNSAGQSMHTTTPYCIFKMNLDTHLKTDPLCVFSFMAVAFHLKRSELRLIP